MATSDHARGQGSNEIMPRYRSKLSPSGYDPIDVWLEASRSDLARVESKNESIRKEIHAEFADEVAGVVQAAKNEGAAILFAAQRQAQASLAAAREEAGETVAAARREASTTIAATRQEATAMVEAANREAARMHREDDDTRREIGPSSKPPLTERFDPRWIDQLWSQA